MKTAELTGAYLDYWTSRAEGVPAEQLAIRRVQRSTDYHVVRAWVRNDPNIGRDAVVMAPSTNWAHGGPLIEKYHISIESLAGPTLWRAELFQRNHSFMGGVWASDDGDTPLQAVCRAVVCAAFGDEVEEVAVT